MQALPTNPFVPDDSWAVIEVNEYMEVQPPGRPTLIMKLPANADFSPALNACLDLFIDGEHGCWEFEGAPVKEKVVTERIHHYLAG